MTGWNRRAPAGQEHTARGFASATARPPPREGGALTAGEGELGRLDEKMEMFVYQNAEKDDCVVGVDFKDPACIDVRFLWICVFTSRVDQRLHPEGADN